MLGRKKPGEVLQIRSGRRAILCPDSEPAMSPLSQFFLFQPSAWLSDFLVNIISSRLVFGNSNKISTGRVWMMTFKIPPGGIYESVGKGSDAFDHA
jgi:hypothetical protein